MYTNNQIAATTATEAQRITDLRYMVLDTINYSPYATADEKAKAAVSVAKCQSAATLTKWYCNVLTLLSERELAPVAFATPTQKREIITLCNRVEISKPEKTKVLVSINRLTVDAANAEIGRLWATVIQRAGEKSPGYRLLVGGKVVSANA